VKAEEAMRAGQNCSGSQAREQGWAIRMRAAMSGDAGAYREFLESVPLLCVCWSAELAETMGFP
jgi:hypothetical protein